MNKKIEKTDKKADTKIEVIKKQSYFKKKKKSEEKHNQWNSLCLFNF